MVGLQMFPDMPQARIAWERQLSGFSPDWCFKERLGLISRHAQLSRGGPLPRRSLIADMHLLKCNLPTRLLFITLHELRPNYDRNQELAALVWRC